MIFNDFERASREKIKSFWELFSLNLIYLERRKKTKIYEAFYELIYTVLNKCSDYSSNSIEPLLNIYFFLYSKLDNKNKEKDL